MADKVETKKPEGKTLALTAPWADVIGPARTDVYEAGEHIVAHDVHARAVAAGVVKG